MPDKLIPGKKRTMAYKKPAAGKFMTQGGSMVASMAAQRNMMPNQFTANANANTNPNEIQNQNQMKPSTFTMKHNKSSFPFKSSPAKHWREFSETTSDEEMQAVTEHNKHMRKPKNKNKYKNKSKK